jgi:nucleoside-diphosphate-sugar epimerase
VPVVPDIRGLCFQALHTDDAAAAFVTAVFRPVHGAFNLAAGPPVDAGVLAGILGARVVRLPRVAARATVASAWHLHLVPASPHLFDAVVRLPIMDTTKARDQLDWHPRYTSAEAITEFLHGLQRGAGMATPPLAPRLPGRRAQEAATGVGLRP